MLFFFFFVLKKLIAQHDCFPHAESVRFGRFSGKIAHIRLMHLCIYNTKQELSGTVWGSLSVKIWRACLCFSFWLFFKCHRAG